jgi:hypothetical protein
MEPETPKNKLRKWLWVLLGIFVLLVIIGKIGKTVGPQGDQVSKPQFVEGGKIALRPTTLHVQGEKIEMYGGNALLFKSPAYAAFYLRYLKKGDLAGAGELYVNGSMLTVDDPLSATLLEYREGNGPSKIRLNLDSLPIGYKKESMVSWEECYVFNIHIEPR